MHDWKIISIASLIAAPKHCIRIIWYANNKWCTGHVTLPCLRCDHVIPEINTRVTLSHERRAGGVTRWSQTDRKKRFALRRHKCFLEDRRCAVDRRSDTIATTVVHLQFTRSTSHFRRDREKSVRDHIVFRESFLRRHRKSRRLYPRSTLISIHCLSVGC